MNTSPLKAMFWKECRENARWAVLSAVALSLGLAYAVYHESAANAAASPDPANGLRLGYVWEDAALVLTIGAPLIALILGLLQILPELRRDEWAFLVHRPASRTTLFWGKVLLGVPLYLLATVLPLLGLMLWNGPSGRQAAPLDWRFMLGAWAAVLAGLPFYFAGLLTALRPARWYGSRALPILAALFAPLAANWQPEFWQVVLSCVLVAAALITAAWGSFVTSGEYGGQPRPARFALGLTLLAGLLVAVVGSFALSVMLYQSLFPAVRSNLSQTQYDVDTDGHILRAFYANSSVRYTDAQGKPLPALEQRNRTGTGVQLLTFTDLINPWMNGQRTSRRYSDPERYIAPLQTFLYHFEDTAWFYLYAQDQAVGYSLRTRRVIGYLGPHGFSDTSNGAGRFSEPLLSSEHMNNEMSLLHFARSVVRFDTRRQEISPLWPLSGGAGIDGVCYVTQSDPERRAFGDAIVVAADHQVHLFTGSGIPLLTTPYAADAAHYPFVQVGTAPLTPGMMPPRARFFFWYSVNGFGAQSWADSKIVTLSSSGRVLQAATLPALQTPPHYQTPGLVGVLVPPAADFIVLGGALDDRWFGDARQRKDWNPLAHDSGLRVLLLVSAVTGLFCAALAWLISRRLGDGRRGQIAWALGTFWLGGYGILLLLALRAWPACVPCPNCGRQRVVDREACEHCGAAWARPQRDGTEIFDEAGREAMAR